MLLSIEGEGLSLRWGAQGVCGGVGARVWGARVWGRSGGRGRAYVHLWECVLCCAL